MKLKKLLVALAFGIATHAHAVITASLNQVPYQNPRQLEAMIKLDDARFDWRQTERVLERYLSSDLKLVYLGERTVFANRFQCYLYQTAEYCKPYMGNLVDLMIRKQDMGLTKMRVLSLEEIPYRDPAPLDDLLAALDAFPPTLTYDEIRAVLVQYLPDDVLVDEPEPADLSYTRAHCMFNQGDLCNYYIGFLAELMRQKQDAAAKLFVNPFGR